MFTGMIEAVGEIKHIQDIDGDKRFIIDSGVLDLSDMTVGDSVSMNGVCLSVVMLRKTDFSADISLATLSCTTLNELMVGEKVNLEKALMSSSRLGGHIVSGHVDGKGVIKEKYAQARSEGYVIGFPVNLGKYICEKGSICVDGVSLTVNKVEPSDFSANIIPHTNTATIFSQYTKGRAVNLEVDIIARYVESLITDQR